MNMINSLKGTAMNLADPELELIDPTPDVHAMFLHFDKLFFWEKLSSRSTVRWSKRMYSCAGTCTYACHGHRGGLCDIALSEPLLKLRPRKDLIETLLHEMIHAYLFITGRDNSRDGHGPYFQAHMHRINRAAGINISIYHDFHDEVKVYQTHWWLCNGPCRKSRPYFGLVRRTCNRPPGPSDYWWNHHKRICGGTFIKIKEPEKPETKNQNKKVAKPKEDITKYLNNNNINNTKNIVKSDKPKKPIIKDISNLPVKSFVGIKSNSRNVVVTKKNVVFNPQVTKSKTPIFGGIGQTLNGKIIKSNSISGIEVKKNIGVNKQIGTNNNKILSKTNNSNTSLNATKHKADTHVDTPPLKMKKIDFYLKNIVTSTLKDIYGQDFNVPQVISNKKLIAEPKQIDLVPCPVCKNNISQSKINTHLDECLSKDLIADCLKDNILRTNNANVHINNLSNEENSKTNKNVSEIILDQRTSAKTNSRTEKNVKDMNDRRKSSGFVLSEDLNKANDSMRKMDVVPSVGNGAPIKMEPSCSNTDLTLEKECLCCGNKLNTSVDEHLYECQAFFNNNPIKQDSPSSTSANLTNDIIVINDDDDEFDDSASLNETGTKLPCPCCLKMVEEIDMNNHLDKCLS